MKSLRPYRAALAVAVGMCALVVAGGVAGASSTSAPITVSMTVPSATSISIDPADPPTAGSCLSGVPDQTDFGTLLPGESAVTATDCTVVFGSSNDTAMLRAYQQDLAGVAMWRTTDGSPDTGFSGNGFHEVAIDGVDEARAAAVEPDGDIVVVGRDSGTDAEGFVATRVTAAGVVDSGGFGTLGEYSYESASDDEAYDVALLPDGRIIIVGEANDTGATSDLLVVMLDAGGDPDPSFGGTGEVLINEAARTRGRGVAIDADGNIVVVGLIDAGTSQPFIARLDQNGNYDTSFSGDGWHSWAVGGNGYLEDVLIQSDGTILTVGRSVDGGSPAAAVTKLTAAGALDTGFNSPDGFLEVPIGTAGSAYDVDTLSDGRIMMAAVVDIGADADMALIRVNENGTLDTSFDGTGYVTHDAGGDDEGAALLVLPDDTTMIGGRAGPGGNRDWMIRRYDTNAQLDESFDDDGVWTRDWAAQEDWLYDLKLGIDGQVIAVGRARPSSTDFGIAVLDADGVADYADGVSDWNTASPNDGFFGACLRSVAGAGVNGEWTTNATCPTTDGTYWNAIDSDGTGLTGKVAESTVVGTTNATANLRFGARAMSDQPAGSYVAPIVFETVAPNL